MNGPFHPKIEIEWLYAGFAVNTANSKKRNLHSGNVDLTWELSHVLEKQLGPII